MGLDLATSQVNPSHPHHHIKSNAFQLDLCNTGACNVDKESGDRTWWESHGCEGAIAIHWTRKRTWEAKDGVQSSAWGTTCRAR